MFIVAGGNPRHLPLNDSPGGSVLQLICCYSVVRETNSIQCVRVKFFFRVKI